jgi:hypothetical protein
MSTTETQVKERPILFSGPMVRALLDGRKTQTRRAVKFPLKVPGVECSVNDCELAPPATWCPYGQPGGRLWVRETFSYALDNSVVYRADPPSDRQEVAAALVGWKPSIFMPREHCRLMLEIVAVRCERVQEITEADALAEGVEMRKPAYYEFGSLIMIGDHNKGIERFAKVQGARAEFAFLINTVNKRRAPNQQGVWEANPWVWVIEFKVVNNLI